MQNVTGQSKKASSKKSKRSKDFDNGDESDAKKKAILSKTVLGVAEHLRLSGKDLAEILNLSESQVSKIKHQEQLLDPKSSSGQLGLILIRIYKNLTALLGEDDELMVQWLKSENKYFNGTPLRVLKQSVEGAVNVIRYLDSVRG